MNRSLRFLMGIGIVTMLVPALALTAPGLFGGLLPNGPDTSIEASPATTSSSAIDDSDEEAALETTTVETDIDCQGPTCAGGETGREFEAALMSASDGTNDESSTTTSGQETESTAPSTTEPSGDRDEKTQADSAKKTDTTTSTAEHKDHDETSSPPKNVQADGTITGSACPCSVTGTVELKGEVSLQGDLVVSGGTLVARPGVNVKGNGHQIVFEMGGKADFQGSKTSTWSGNGSNANLKRDINFTNVSRIMFHHGAGKSTLKYFRVSNSGVSERLGFYPLHFHKNGNSTRGTLVEGVVIDNSANHAFVPHGSHGITFRNTIAKNIIREAYWWDPGPGNESHDTVYDHALADGVDYPRSLGDIGLHHAMAGFFLGRGNGNVVRNSVTRNVDGGKNCAGFHWPEDENAVWGFKNNAAYGGGCHGVFIWQNDSLPHVLQGFSGNGIAHGAYTNLYKFQNLNVESVEVHALGANNDSPIYDGGSLGNVLIRSHTLDGGPVIFRNVTIGSFTVDNGGGRAGHYILDNTNLSCGDIRYESVAGGTKVVINGNEC